MEYPAQYHSVAQRKKQKTGGKSSGPTDSKPIPGDQQSLSYGDAGYLINPDHATWYDEMELLPHDSKGQWKVREDRCHAALRVAMLFDHIVLHTTLERHKVPIILPYLKNLAHFNATLKLSCKARQRFARSREIYEEEKWQAISALRMYCCKREAINMRIRDIYSANHGIVAEAYQPQPLKAFMDKIITRPDYQEHLKTQSAQYTMLCTQLKKHWLECTSSSSSARAQKTPKPGKRSKTHANDSDTMSIGSKVTSTEASDSDTMMFDG
jgi:hypothetical protein